MKKGGFVKVKCEKRREGGEGLMNVFFLNSKRTDGRMYRAEKKKRWGIFFPCLSFSYGRFIKLFFFFR